MADATVWGSKNEKSSAVKAADYSQRKGKRKKRKGNYGALTARNPTL